MLFLLWLLAVILVVAGIIEVVRGIAARAAAPIVIGIVLIIVGFLVGPGGASIFT